MAFVVKHGLYLRYVVTVPAVVEAIARSIAQNLSSFPMG